MRFIEPKIRFSSKKIELSRMTNYPIAENEEERLAALYQLNILDSEPEEVFDDIVKLASAICEKPIAMISLLDRNRQWFKAKTGMEINETPREMAIGQYAIYNNELLVIEDAQSNEKFKNHPMVVSEPHVRFYAGTPLAYDQFNIGTLCVIDTKPGVLNESQKSSLQALAKNTMKLFTLRYKMQEVSRMHDLLHTLKGINEEYIKSHQNKHLLFSKILDFLLQFTESRFGLIGEINDKKQEPKLEAFAIKSSLNGPQNPSSYASIEDAEKDFKNLKTLLTHTLTTGENLISNDAANLPEKSDVQDQNALLTKYMGIAIKDKKDKLIGMIGIGNKPSGYLENELELLKPIVSTCGTLILAIRSELKKMEVEAENQKITRQLMNAQSIAKIGSWELNLNTNKTNWSEELYRIFEIPQKIKQSSGQDYAQTRSIGPKNLISNEKLFAEIMEGKSVSYKQKLEFEDGRTKIISIRASPFKDESGKVVIVQGTCQDITEQRQKSIDLQRFFDLSPDFLFITNAEGLILKNSSSFNLFLGYSSQELQEKTIFDILHPDDVPNMKAMLHELHEKGKLSTLKNRILKKEGDSIDLEWTAAYDKESKRIYASAKDITEKAELEEKILQSKVEAEKTLAKETFLANMSHEIRTPLNAIIGFNEILAKSSLTPDQRKKVEIINSASKTLSVIINDILDLSKLESGKLELDKFPFSIETVCRQVIQLKYSDAKAKGIKLFFSYDNEIPELVSGDEIRLTQILINLISNAIKFTEAGHVELKVREGFHEAEKAQIVFSVSDTGIGIPKNKLDTIFERFSQAETYTTRIYGGTGLGLSIVKSLIELHNGELNVRSTVGEGTTFTVSLNYEISNEGHELSTPADSENYQNISAMHDLMVLLVEDNEHNQLLADSYLKKHGVKLDKASNGKIALEKLKTKSYDIILMDLQMPIMDGIETTEHIRNILKLKTPIIACSAHAMTSERKKCLASGMNDYISKPYSEKTLLQVMAPFLPKSSNGKISAEPVLTSTQPHNGHQQATEPVAVPKNEGRRSPEWLANAVLAKLPEDIRILTEALKLRDWKALEFKAHNLISSLSILHEDLGIELSRQLEKASRECEEKNSMIIGTDLIEFLKALENAENER